MELIEWSEGKRSGRDATEEDRERLGIRRGNGTVGRVDLDPHQAVPRIETLKRDLPWHFALRDIMTQGGPVHATSVYVFYIYEQAFHYFRIGRARKPRTGTTIPASNGAGPSSRP